MVICLEDCIKKRKYLPNDEKLKKIVKFLKDQKTNKKIFTDNCIICLEKFEETNEEAVELNINDDDCKSVKLIKEKEVSVLNCGHQFHTNCIANWLKKINTCPICRQIANPELKEDNNKIVWRVQTDLDPSYNYINYDSLYVKDFYEPSYDNDYSGGGSYDFGGGCDCGGGASGSW